MCYLYVRVYIIFSLREYSSSPQQNLSKEELAPLLSLKLALKNKDIVIQKSDQGNSFVIVDKEVYSKRMEDLLSDQRKLKMLI